MAKGIRSFPLRLKTWLKLLPTLTGKSSPLARLSPYENYVLHGGDDLHDSGSLNKVLVLGGYEGLSTLKWAEIAEAVYSVEPVPQFAEKIRQSASSLSNIEVLEFGVGSKEGKLRLSLLGDGSSQFRTSQNFIEVPLRDISEIVEEIGEIDLLEVNIEGGEYEVLERLIETGKLRKIKTILVQFHKDGLDFASRKNTITMNLSETHFLSWSFPWVWDKWERK